MKNEDIAHELAILSLQKMNYSDPVKVAEQYLLAKDKILMKLDNNKYSTNEDADELVKRWNSL